MNTEQFENFKEQYDRLKSDISEIKEFAEDIIAFIENDSFIPCEKAITAGSKLDEYRTRLEEFKNVGTELAIDTEAKISAIAIKIQDFENSQKLVMERQMVLDFLHLTADADELISRLDTAKIKLTEICRMEDAKEKLVPFGYVVDCVKSESDDFSEDVLDTIEDGIDEVGRYIVRAINRGKIRIDEDADISGYLDNSCELLAPENGRETPTVPDAETVDAGVDETEKTGEKVPISPVIPTDGEPDEPKNPDSGTGNEIGNVPTFGGFLDDIVFNYSDVPATELSTSRFKNDLKSMPEMAGLISLVSFVKIYDPESEADRRIGEFSEEVLSFAIEQGYISKASIGRTGEEKEYFVLTSKGNASIERNETRKLMESLTDIRPRDTQIPTKEFTPDFAVQVLLIKEYVSSLEDVHILSICFYNDKVKFAFVGLMTKSSKKLTFVIAANFDRDNYDGDSFRDAIEALNKFDVVILAKSKKDIDYLENEAKIKASDDNAIRYILEGQAAETSGSSGSGKITDEAVTGGTEGNDNSPEDSESVSWESLGIENPDLISYSKKGIVVEASESKKASKAFSVKEFKSDMRSFPETKRAIQIMHTGQYVTFFTPENVAAINKANGVDFTAYCEKLFQMGYLEKTSSEGYDTFYNVTQRGSRAYSTKDAAAFLETKVNSEYKYIKEPKDEFNFISRQLYIKTIPVSLMIDDQIKFESFKVRCGNNNFSVSYGLKDGLTYSFFSVVSDEPEDFELDDEKTTELLESVNVLVIMGANAKQARALSSYCYSKFSDKLNGIRFAYYDMETNTLKDFEGDNPTGGPDNGDTKDGKKTGGSTDGSPEAPDSNDGEDGSDGQEGPINGIPSSVIDTPPIFSTGGGVQKTVLTAEDKERILATSEKMIMADKLYCATAYMAAASNNYPELRNHYDQLAFAVNDPMAECSYSSQKMFGIYFNEETAVSDYYTVSAVLRNFFLDHIRYDYDMLSLCDAVKENKAYLISPKLKSIVRSLMEFKRSNGHGLDFYADYRISGAQSYENNLREICEEAKRLYAQLVDGVTKEKAKNERFLETKRLIFARNGDMANMLSYVAENDSSNLELIKLYVSETFIKEGTEFGYGNLDPAKIDEFVDAAWDRAQETLFFKRNNIKLVRGLRQNIINKIKESVAVLCKYVDISQTSVVKEADPGYIAYKRIRNGLLDDIETSLGDFNQGDGVSAEEKVVVYALAEVKSKIDGTYREEQRKYFYLPFLQNEYVLLNEVYMPILESVEDLPEMAAYRMVEKHFNGQEISLEERINSILYGEDDYGSANLIVEYFKTHPNDTMDVDSLTEQLSAGVKFPRGSIENRKKEFEEYLELAQCYGQIDNTIEDKKETMLQIVERWYEIVQESDNYGFFYKIVEAFKNKIKQDSMIHAIDLKRNLDAYKASNNAWEENDLINETVKKIEERIKFQNYSAAEDLLNRLQANDIETAISFIEKDYLAEFFDEYGELARFAGTSAGTFLFTLSGHNKESKGGQGLLDNWPKRLGFPEGKINDLLTNLGFNGAVVSTQKQIQGRFDNYFVKLNRPANGRKSNYKHPISIFGSEAEETDFRVVCVYGKRKPDELIDIFNEIGNAKNTLIFLDCSLNLPERRELARRAKKECNGKTFAVVDRVVITYLARHYSQTAINRMLMAVIIPFGYYQPYISDSSKPMPPEIFMGRRTELEKIESPTGVNIVYGGRQLGKSALLRMAQKDINWDENGDRAVLVDIKGLDYTAAAKKVAEELCDQFVLDEELPESDAGDWHAICRAVKNVLRNGNEKGQVPYLLLLLDEADVFIESCEAVNYAPFDALKDIQSVGSGRFKFVVAGLRNVVRFNKNAALGHNSVLTHLSHLTVTPFKAAEARELLEVPLSYLGFRFPDDSKTDMLISNIFGTTNYFPGLLQMYCAKLIEAMKKEYAGYDESETPPYVIREEHIKKVLADKSLEQQIREKFEITLKVDEDDYYYLLALLVAFHYHNVKTQSGCSPKDIYTIAKEYSISKITMLTIEEIQALMEEMRELNVFQQVGNGNYRFARRSFCEMMGLPQDIDDKMIEYAG